MLWCEWDLQAWQQLASRTRLIVDILVTVSNLATVWIGFGAISSSLGTFDNHNYYLVCVAIVQMMSCIHSSSFSICAHRLNVVSLYKHYLSLSLSNMAPTFISLSFRLSNYVISSLKGNTHIELTRILRRKRVPIDWLHSEQAIHTNTHIYILRLFRIIMMLIRRKNQAFQRQLLDL